MKKKKLMIPIWYFALFSSTKWLTNQSSSLPSSHNNVIGHMKLSLFISICLWWHLCPPLWFPLLIFFHMQFLCNWIEKDNSAICTPPPQKKKFQMKDCFVSQGLCSLERKPKGLCHAFSSENHNVLNPV
jgi:hypothetical protein